MSILSRVSSAAQNLLRGKPARPLVQQLAARQMQTTSRQAPAPTASHNTARPVTASASLKPVAAAPAGLVQKSEDRGQRSEGGGQRPGGEDALVWNRGQKYARGAVEELGPAKTTVAAVKTVRVAGDTKPPQATPAKPPVTPAGKPAEKAAEKKPVTAADIVKQYGENIRRSTHRALYVGGLVYTWIVNQPERAPDAQFDRAGAIRHLRKKLQEARHDERSCRIERDLRCYHLVHRLGGEAESLPISAIRQLLPLLEREKDSERPKLKPAYAEQTKALWARMLAEKLPADVVRDLVLKILPAKSPVGDEHRQSRQAATVMRLIPTLSAEERRQAMRVLREVEAQAKTQPAAAIAD